MSQKKFKSKFKKEKDVNESLDFIDDDIEDETDLDDFIGGNIEKYDDIERERYDKRFRKKKKFKTEDSSTIEGVLDLSTSKEIYKLHSLGYIKGLGGVVSTGKEANIYHALSADSEKVYNLKELAIKIYRTRTLDFKKIKIYIDGDHRFAKTGRKSHQIIQTWALKEFKNLVRAFETGIRVPKPISVRRNVLLMEFIGKNGLAATQLRSIKNFESDEVVANIYNDLLEQVSKLYLKSNLVHGDLSAYNVLIFNELPYIIDMGQSVLTTHKLALPFLFRDIQNVNYYFETLDHLINLKSAEDIFEDITGQKAIPEFLEIR